MREAIVGTIHPSCWITFDRDFLAEIAAFTFDDSRYAALMDALHEFRLTRSLPPTPPMAVIRERLQKLENSEGKANSLLRVEPMEIGSDEVESRGFRRSAANVNLYIWQLLEAVGATSPNSITPELISKAKKNAQELASSHRPEGVSTTGRQEIPGFVQLVTELIDIRESAGMQGGVSHWDDYHECYRGYLHDVLPQILRANELIDQLDVFHGGQPPRDPVIVSGSDLEELDGPTGWGELVELVEWDELQRLVGQKELEGLAERHEALPDSTIRSYFRRAKQQISEK